MNQNPDLKDVPAIREYLDQLFQWEDSGAEEEGKTINDFPEIRDKFREVEEVINHAMGVEGGGRRGLDRFIRSTFLFSPEGQSCTVSPFTTFLPGMTLHSPG